ncbi:MAG TPA: Bax inhibitor-1/YccA family protein [Candidatus Obscuribacterales bacterium]
MAVATANPALNTDAYTEARRSQAMQRLQGGRALVSSDNVMTLNGTVGKCFVLLALVCAGACWTWQMFWTSGNPAVVTPWMVGGLIGGLVVALITTFKRTLAPFTAPLYAMLQGLALGGLSAVFQARYPGIVLQAVGLSLGTCAAMLLVYASRLIRPTHKFMIGVAAAAGGLMLFYLATMVLGFFHIQVPFLFAGGPIGIAFSVFVVIIAALNLIIDFGVIESGVDMQAPKYMEWYSAFGLMVTLVWLYVEFLRLLAKVRRSD